MEFKRLDARKFMDLIFEKCQAAGVLSDTEVTYEEHLVGIDYYLAEADGLELSADEFDVGASISYGCSEGIYLSIYLEGCWADKSEGYSKLHIGTVKTLQTDQYAAEALGRIAGAVCFFGREIIYEMHNRLSSGKYVNKFFRSLSDKRDYEQNIFVLHNNVLTHEDGVLIIVGPRAQAIESFEKSDYYSSEVEDIISMAELQRIEVRTGRSYQILDFWNVG